MSGDNQDQYIKMVFQNAIEQIRAFGANLEQLQKGLVFKPKSKLTKIACIGTLPDFESFARCLGESIGSANYPNDREFFLNGTRYINIHDVRPKEYYPKCDAIIFLGGYLNPSYTKLITDLEDEQEIYLLNPFEISNLIK